MQGGGGGGVQNLSAVDSFCPIKIHRFAHIQVPCIYGATIIRKGVIRAHIGHSVLPTSRGGYMSGPLLLGDPNNS